jgi:hypothetical protein
MILYLYNIYAQHNIKLWSFRFVLDFITKFYTTYTLFITCMYSKVFFMCFNYLYKYFLPAIRNQYIYMIMLNKS